MDLVDRHRLATLIGLGPEGAMRLVAPVVTHRRGGDRGGGRAQLRAERERIGLQRQPDAVGSDDLVFVGLALADIGDEDLPDAGVEAVPHRMAAAVPVVEGADDRNPPGVGRPDREVHARGALMRHQMRAELVEQAQMRALGNVVVVHRSEHRAERIGIGHRPFAAGIAGAVAQRLALADGEPAFEEAGIVTARQLASLLAGQREGGDGFGMRDEAARDQLAADLLHAEHGEGIAVDARDDRLDVGGGGLFWRGLRRRRRAGLLHAAAPLPRRIGAI